MRVCIAIIANIFTQYKGGTALPGCVINHRVQAHCGFGFAFYTCGCHYKLWSHSWAVYLHTADNYHRLTRPTLRGAKRPRWESSHGIPAALSPLVTPSKPAVWTHIACSQAPSRGCFPSPPRPHTPAGCDHGGTRKSSTSRKLQTWSVNPAAIAGVWGCHRVAEPLPLVGRCCGNGWRKEAWGKQKF